MIFLFSVVVYEHAYFRLFPFFTQSNFTQKQKSKVEINRFLDKSRFFLFLVEDAKTRLTKKASVCMENKESERERLSHLLYIHILSHIIKKRKEKISENCVILTTKIRHLKLNSFNPYKNSLVNAYS